MGISRDKDLIKPLDRYDLIEADYYCNAVGGDPFWIMEDPVRKLEQDLREAIKSLIEVNKQQISEMNRDHLSEFCLFGIRVKNRTELLEKLTGHSWSEIKNENM